MKKRLHAQTYTYSLEKKLLDMLASRIYRYIHADQLSLLSLFGACVTALSYLLVAQSMGFLWAANVGLILHWIGDSLDGRVALLRGESRPAFGYYMDHLLDACSTIIIMLGIAANAVNSFGLWIAVLLLYLLLMIHLFLKAAVVGKLEISIGRFGPTEVRIFLIALNIATSFLGNPFIPFGPFMVKFFDMMGIVGFIVILIHIARGISSTSHELIQHEH